MPAKSLVQKRARQRPCLMYQQLSFDPVDSRRLLQGLDNVREQARLHDVRLGKALAIGDKQISNHPLAAFIHKKGVAKNAAAIHGGVTRQDLRIEIAEDHVRRTAIVPREQARPDLGFVVQQGAHINRGKMS
jgi:hypothetical protein